MAPPADIPKIPGIGAPPPPAAPAAPGQTAGGGRGAAPAAAALSDLADIRPLDIPHALQILVAEVRAAIEASLLQATAPSEAPAPALDGWLPPELPGEPALPTDPAFPEFPPAAPEASGTGPAPPTEALPAALTADAVRDLATLLLESLPAPGLLAAAVTGLAGRGADSGPPAPPQAAQQIADLLLRSLPPETGDGPALAVLLPKLLEAVETANAQALAIIDTWRDVPAATRDAALVTTQLVANLFSEEPLQSVWLRPEWALFLPRLERFRRRRRRLRRRLEDPDARFEPPEPEERR